MNLTKQKNKNKNIVKVVRQTSLSLKGGGVAEQVDFWPMRQGLGKRFGIVFSFAVVATDTELGYQPQVDCSVQLGI
jgi:hypothetical protein